MTYKYILTPNWSNKNSEFNNWIQILTKFVYIRGPGTGHMTSLGNGIEEICEPH